MSAHAEAPGHGGPPPGYGTSGTSTASWSA